MEIVIKIPESTYKYLAELVDAGGEPLGYFERVIMRGTPLPKGHGRLVDADAICKDIISALGIHDENFLLEAEKAVYKRIKNAPIIIEADKAESEK